MRHIRRILVDAALMTLDHGRESIAAELELLKTDALGREKVPTGKREAILEASVECFERNGSAFVLDETRVFIYDGWNVLEEAVISGGTVTESRRHIWGNDLSGTRQGAGGVGGLLGMVIDDGTALSDYYYHYDANGNVMSITNDSGTEVANYRYSVFGELIASSGIFAEENPWRFSTKYADGETGFSYYGFRYDDAVTGRWLSRDPIGERGGVNLYGMVGNGPINWIDYLGLDRLIFDGEKVCRLSDDLKDCKNCWLADSGKPLDDNSGSGKSSDDLNDDTPRFDYSEERQRLEDLGPIPEGDYWVPSNRATDPSEPGVWSREDWNSYANSDGGGWIPWKTNVNPRSGEPWGDYFVRLEPDPGTDTFGRYDFNLHGGTVRGSAGCIDLGHCEAPFFEEVLRDGAGERVRLTVDYSGASTQGCPTPDPCSEEE